MKLVDGPTMANWKPFDGLPSESLETARHVQQQIAVSIQEIARAIHHAHQRGVLHRDLKPSNVLLDSEGHPYVADFGLARRNHVDLSMTHTGMIIGTPSYMAPELIFPEEGTRSRHATRSVMTTAVDIYGLGAILYFLLSGRPPFQGETVLATLAQVRDRSVTPPRTFNRGIDPDLEAVCLKCLAKQPSDRYDSAESLADDLQNWLDGKPISARPAGSAEKFWKWCRRNRIVASLLTLTAFATCFAFFSLFWGLRSATVARDEAVSQRQTALRNLRSVIAEINNLEHIRPDLSTVRYDLMSRIQKHLEPMLKDPVHGKLADETNFWLEVDAGEVQDFRGNFPEARRHFERAMAIAKRIEAERRPNHERIMSYAHAYLADALAFTGHAVEGSREHEKSLNIRLKLVESNPTLQARADLALAYMKNCWALYFAHDECLDPGYAERGVVQANEAIQRFQALTHEEPQNLWHARYLGKSAAAGAECLIRTGRFLEAIEMCDVGVRELQNASQRMPQYTLGFEFYEGKLCLPLAYAAWRCGNFELGVSAGARAEDIHRRMTEHDENAFLQRQHHLYAIDLYGQNLQCAGRIQESIDTLKKGMRLGVELDQDNPGVDNVHWAIQHFREHLSYVLVMNPEHDEETLTLIDECKTFCLDQYERKPDAASLERLLAAHLGSAEMLLMMERYSEAELPLKFINNSIASLESKDEIYGNWVARMRDYTELNRAIHEDALTPSAIQSRLAELSIRDGTMLRLFYEFRGRSDWSSLAAASLRHFRNAKFFFPKFHSAQALAEAIQKLPESDTRQQHLLSLRQMIEELKSFGPHVVPMINSTPAFLSL